MTRQKKTLPPLLGRFFKLGIFGYTVILLLLCLSNFSLFSPNWPFGLISSFMLYLILAAPFVLAVCAWVWRKGLFILLPLTAFAFHPFFLFNKYDPPNSENCEGDACLSIISVNLHHDLKALMRLSDSPQYAGSDLILLMDLPYNLPRKTLAEISPNHSGIHVFERTRAGQRLGSAMAVISKEQIENLTLLENGLENEKYNLRGLLQFSYRGLLSRPAKLFVIHPMMPLPREGMVYRDQLIDRAIAEIGDSENFILLGDFNLTPWEPKFTELPGRRAGNPRWVSTWDARKPWLRLAIDHVMIGGDYQTVEAEVVPSIGSDHHPLYTVVRRK